MMTTLRSATAAEHAQLEEAVAIQRRFRSPATYCELLEAFYGFVRPLEDELAVHDWARVGLNFDQRRKVSLLEKDLAIAGSAPEDLEQCDSLPDVSSIDRAFGALYVMEGSTLGGQHIAKLAGAAKIDPDALHYFRSYGLGVGEMWKSFGDALNRFAEKCGDAPEIINGAQETFSLLRSWFLRQLTHS